ncbi:MAG: hypothetical protein ACP5QP_07290 [Brevinematia bacterium]
MLYKLRYQDLQPIYLYVKKDRLCDLYVLKDNKLYYLITLKDPILDNLEHNLERLQVFKEISIERDNEKEEEITKTKIDYIDYVPDLLEIIGFPYILLFLFSAFHNLYWRGTCCRFTLPLFYLTKEDLETKIKNKVKLTFVQEEIKNKIHLSNFLLLLLFKDFIENFDKFFNKVSENIEYSILSSFEVNLHSLLIIKDYFKTENNFVNFLKKIKGSNFFDHVDVYLKLTNTLNLTPLPIEAMNFLLNTVQTKSLSIAIKTDLPYPDLIKAKDEIIKYMTTIYEKDPLRELFFQEKSSFKFEIENKTRSLYENEVKINLFEKAPLEQKIKDFVNTILSASESTNIIIHNTIKSKNYTLLYHALLEIFKESKDLTATVYYLYEIFKFFYDEEEDLENFTDLFIQKLNQEKKTNEKIFSQKEIAMTLYVLLSRLPKEKYYQILREVSTRIFNNKELFKKTKKLIELLKTEEKPWKFYIPSGINLKSYILKEILKFFVKTGCVEFENIEEILKKANIIRLADQELDSICECVNEVLKSEVRGINLEELIMKLLNWYSPEGFYVDNLEKLLFNLYMTLKEAEKNREDIKTLIEFTATLIKKCSNHPYSYISKKYIREFEKELIEDKALTASAAKLKKYLDKVKK